MTESTSDIALKTKRLKYTGNFIFYGFIIFTALVVLYAGYANWMRDTEISKKFNNLTSAKSSLQETSTVNQTAIQQLEQKVNTLQTQVAQQNSILQQFAPNQTLHQKFVLLQASHLARLAYYNLMFSKDVPAAINLLQASDEQIANLNDPSLLNLREQLQKNIADLKALPPLDISGLLTKIQVLQNQVSQLPILIPTTNESSTESSNNSAIPAWRRGLENSLSTIQKLIVIRHTDKKISPILPAVQQAYLQQNLQLLLQQAQWAVLRGQQAVYQTSLEQAKSLIEQHFVTDAPMTQSILQSLSDLSKVNVAPELPNILATVQALSAERGPHA